MRAGFDALRAPSPVLTEGNGGLVALSAFIVINAVAYGLGALIHDPHDGTSPVVHIPSLFDDDICPSGKEVIQPLIRAGYIPTLFVDGLKVPLFVFTFGWMLLAYIVTWSVVPVAARALSVRGGLWGKDINKLQERHVYVDVGKKA